MASDQAPNRLYAMVRDFAVKNAETGLAVRYFTKPDERADLTLISLRVYGSRRQAMVIQAAAGLDSAEALVAEQMLVLPPSDTLREMRREAGVDDYKVL